MNQEKVLETLKQATQPMKSAEIATASGLDKAEVDKALKALKKDGKIDSPKRCYYAVN